MDVVDSFEEMFMKKSIFGLFLVLASTTGLNSTAHAAAGMVCGGISDSGGTDEASGMCYTADGQSYSYKMSGIGIGLQSSLEGFAIACPNVRKSRLTTLTLYGVEVTASPLFGAEAAVFTNKHLGTCIMTGVNIGLGVSVNIDSLTFHAN